MKITKEKKKNVSRSKLFGIVINPKFDEIIDWKSMSNLEMENKLKECVKKTLLKVKNNQD